MGVNNSRVAGPFQVDIIAGGVVIDESTLESGADIAIRRAAGLSEPFAELRRYSFVSVTDSTLQAPLDVSMRTGSSIVRLEGTTFETVDVDLGSGRDFLVVKNAVFTASSTFNGGAGFDRYFTTGNLSAAAPEFVAFELEADTNPFDEFS